MAALYTDENVPSELANSLRTLGHDVLTVQADGRASQGIGDPDVLARAIELGRAIVTNNRRDFHRLHRFNSSHCGIITYTHDTNRTALAGRIHAAICAHASLASVLIRIVLPNTTPPMPP